MHNTQQTKQQQGQRPEISMATTMKTRSKKLYLIVHETAIPQDSMDISERQQRGRQQRGSASNQRQLQRTALVMDNASKQPLLSSEGLKGIIVLSWTRA